MKKLNNVAAIAVLIVTNATAQIGSGVKALLASDDPVKREEAFHELEKEARLRPNVSTALIGLLAKEGAVQSVAYLSGHRR